MSVQEKASYPYVEGRKPIVTLSELLLVTSNYRT